MRLVSFVRSDGAARVVGINTAVAGNGLGLAVPINDITRRIVGALMHEGRFRRAYIGIAGGVAATGGPVTMRGVGAGSGSESGVAHLVQDRRSGCVAVDHVVAHFFPPVGGQAMQEHRALGRFFH